MSIHSTHWGEPPKTLWKHVPILQNHGVPRFLRWKRLGRELERTWRVTHGRLSRSIRQRLVFLSVGIVVLLGLIALLLKPGSSFVEVLRRAGPNVAPTLIAGLGMTGIIYTGCIDLSIASIVAVAGTVFGIAVHHGMPAPLSFAVCFATAAILSGINGWVIRRSRLPAIIVTLAGLAAYRGVALILADSAVKGFPGYFSVPGDAYHWPGKGVPTELLGVVVALVLAWEWGARMPRMWMALGSNEEAVRLSGLNPGKVLQSAYGVGGLLLGMAALIYVTRVTAIEPSRMALGFELSVIGAVVLGGTNIFGGEGCYLGTVLGAFFLHFVGEALIFAEISAYWQEVITGTVILAVIGMDCALHRKRKLMEELA